MIAFQLFIVRAVFIMIAVMIALISWFGAFTREGIEEHLHGAPDCPETTHSWWGRGIDDREWDSPLPALVLIVS